MGNITGNHDFTSFYHLSGEALEFGEDEKEAGWNRDIKVENPVGYRKLEQLIAFMWTFQEFRSCTTEMSLECPVLEIRITEVNAL